MPKRKAPGGPPLNGLRKSPRTEVETATPAARVARNPSRENASTKDNVDRSAQYTGRPCAPGSVIDWSDNEARESGRLDAGLPPEVAAQASTAAHMHTSSRRPTAKRSCRKGTSEHTRNASSAKSSARPPAATAAIGNQNSCSAGAKADARTEWDAMFERLHQFKRERGYVPTITETIQDNELQQWVNAQRRAMARFHGLQVRAQANDQTPTLDSVQVDKLQRLGLISHAPPLRTNDKPKTWEDNYGTLLRFIQHFGHARVRRTFDTTQFPHLGTWVYRQRRLYHDGVLGDNHRSLSIEKIKKLDAVGFDWFGARKSAWEAKFNMLRRYIAEKGTSRIAADEPGYPGLSVWVKNQRVAIRCEKLGNARPKARSTASSRKKMTPTQMRRLESLGFEWAGLAQTAWDQKFELLCQYKKEFGTTRVAQRHDSKKYPRLGKWVKTQRDAYANENLRKAGMPLGRKKNRISPQQIEKLESIGFQWGRVKLTAWDKMFARLERFVEKYGHADFPETLDTAEFPMLGAWAKAQRAAYHSEQKNGATNSGSLTQLKVCKLDRLGFKWDAFSADGIDNEATRSNASSGNCIDSQETQPAGSRPPHVKKQPKASHAPCIQDVPQDAGATAGTNSNGHPDARPCAEGSTTAPSLDRSSRPDQRQNQQDASHVQHLQSEQFLSVAQTHRRQLLHVAHIQSFLMQNSPALHANQLLQQRQPQVATSQPQIANPSGMYVQGPQHLQQMHHLRQLQEFQQLHQAQLLQQAQNATRALASTQGHYNGLHAPAQPRVLHQTLPMPLSYTGFRSPNTFLTQFPQPTPAFLQVPHHIYGQLPIPYDSVARSTLSSTSINNDFVVSNGGGGSDDAHQPPNDNR